MTLFIQDTAAGGGGGNLDPAQAAVDLAVIANGDTGLGLALPVGNREQVTYARSEAGVPPIRLDDLANTNFMPDYGGGGGPQAVPVVILPVLANFVFNDGTSILTAAGRALPPSNSGLPGAGLNTTTDCLVIYDTTQNNGAGYCTARAGTNGTLDLQTPNPVILYHELSHAFRIVTNALNALSPTCNPSSPEENAAITEENDLRTQIANETGSAPVLRDPGIHCGGLCSGGSSGTCCIIASVASGSPVSDEVAALRAVRDGLLRRGEVGFAFFETLHRDYYAFSPQVCTLMARRPALRPLVLEAFVRPLVSMLGLVVRYALGAAGPTALGGTFAAEHEDRVAARARLAMLRRAREVLRGHAPDLPDEQRELAALLAPGLRSEHVVWALVEPVLLHESVLAAHVAGRPADALGEGLAAGIDAWAARLPLDDVWAALSAAELRSEVALLETTLLRTPAARTTFRRRLVRRHGGASAVRELGDGRIEGGAGA